MEKFHIGSDYILMDSNGDMYDICVTEELPYFGGFYQKRYTCYEPIYGKCRINISRFGYIVSMEFTKNDCPKPHLNHTVHIVDIQLNPLATSGYKNAAAAAGEEN